MNRFYTLSTDKFVPISYDNKHLFNTYELVNNFIRTRISATYKNILAKPILQNHEVGWYSPFLDLRETVDVAAQRKYFAFRDELQRHIDQLSSSSDPNARYWVGLLEKVFAQKDNKLFTNGQDICVVWGWAFDNYQIQRPDIDPRQEEEQALSEKVLPPTVPTESPQPPVREVPQQEVPQPPIEAPQEEEEEEQEEEETTPEASQEETPELPTYQEWMPEEEAPQEEEKKSFLEFLKEFAATYWWLLVVLLVAICFVFLVKSFIY